jgi:hypothetical protein
MRRIVPLAIAAAAIGLAASQAYAGVNISVSAAQPVASALGPGWSGYSLTITADATSIANGGITLLDFKNDPLGLAPNDPTNSTIGIRGTFASRDVYEYVEINPEGDPNTDPPTPPVFPHYDPVKSASTSLSSLAQAQRLASMFLTNGYYTLSVSDQFTLVQNPNDPRNPAPDQPGIEFVQNRLDYGVGSSLTFSGAADAKDAKNSINFAYVIVPSGGTWVQGYIPGAILTVRGAVLDASSTDKTKAYPVQLSYVAAPVPEPASLGVLALGGLGLLARRRRSA